MVKSMVLAPLPGLVAMFTQATWVDGSRTGEGTYTWTSGDVYTGAFVDGSRTGEGTFTWTNGDCLHRRLGRRLPYW